MIINFFFYVVFSDCVVILRNRNEFCYCSGEIYINFFVLLDKERCWVLGKVISKYLLWCFEVLKVL